MMICGLTATNLRDGLNLIIAEYHRHNMLLFLHSTNFDLERERFARQVKLLVRRLRMLKKMSKIIHARDKPVSWNRYCNVLS
jgi:hypothetical protein